MKSMHFQTHMPRSRAVNPDAQPVLEGETPITGAPRVQISSQLSCIPQHFLNYAHTRSSVEAILHAIECDDHFIPFVNETSEGLFIQIGIIGRDNYTPSHKQNGAKIVYGRKWRVEPNLPSSEIIQTVFLAIKTAREHEVRECFRVRLGGHWTTPFNNHHDLPLMARCADHLNRPSQEEIAQPITALTDIIRYDHARLNCTGLEQRKNGQWIIDLSLTPSPKSHLPDVCAGIALSIITADLKMNTILHAIMDALIQASNDYVAQVFKYKDFARFEPSVDVLRLSALSLSVRDSQHEAHFKGEITSARYDTDATRVPTLHKGSYGEKIKAKLIALNVQAGFLPRSEA